MRRLSLPLAVSLILFSGMSTAEPVDSGDRALMARGQYLATAADCGACHTSPHQGEPMAGGYAIASPMGSIYASNITPSPTAGIGGYSEAEFARAVREGINKQGQHLYPAMPYPSYAKISDEDIHALYVWFMHGVRPVDVAAPQTRLPFPFNLRASMAVWNLMFAENTRFVPSPTASDEVNRGDYLVNALAHCDTCHTPRNLLMGQQNDQPLAGGSLGSWYAPDITPDVHSGIGGWSKAELAQYLKTGHVKGKAQAAGPMAEAVEHSLQHLTDPDINAIVAYLQQVPASGGGAARSRDGFGQPSSTEQQRRGDNKADDAGWQIYSSTCAACHQPDGQGTARYPSLFHNTATGAEQADNLIATILFGVQRKVQDEAVAMPAFGPAAAWTDRLSDRQVADVSNYVLQQYGNPALHVTEQQVQTVREGGETPLLVRLTRPWVLTAVVIVAGAMVAGGLALTRRKRRRYGTKK
nr:cytochrome c [Erwinia sp. Leaf53]